MYSGGALGVVVCSRRATGFSVVSVVVLGEGVRLVFRVVRSGPSPPLGLRGDECQILLVRATACNTTEVRDAINRGCRRMTMSSDQL